MFVALNSTDSNILSLKLLKFNFDVIQILILLLSQYSQLD